MKSVRLKGALVEGTVVLFGILLAFGIQALWENKQEAAQVDAYLASLALELEENRTRLTRRVDGITSDIAVTQAYLGDVVGARRGTVSQDSIRGMIAAMGPLRTASISRAAFDDLVSGGLQSITDARLRRLILTYGQMLEFYSLRQRAAEDWFVRRGQLYDELEGDLVGALYRQRTTGGTDLIFEIDPDAFVLNRRYGNLLAARTNHLGNTRASATALIEAIQALGTAMSQRE